MSIPVLRGRIRLCAPQITRLPSGGEQKAWTAPVPVFAKVDYLGSRVYTAALAEQTGCSVRVIVRKRMVASGWRVLLDGVLFAVSTVEPHKAPGFLVLMLRKDDGNG